MHADHHDLIERLHVAHQAEIAARQALEDATKATAKAIVELREASNMSWDRIGELLELTGEAVRWRSYQETGAPASVADRKAGDDEARPNRRKYEPGWVGVSDAAKRLGVSRTWVYRLIGDEVLEVRIVNGFRTISEESINKVIAAPQP